jgi:hypothetical protein
VQGERLRQRPLVAPAPLVTAHAAVFRDLCEHRGQGQHVQPDLTGLIVLDNPSLATSTRGVLDRAAQTNRSRLFSEAPWCQARVKDRRGAYRLQQTQGVRGPTAASALLLDATWCAPVGRLLA